MALFRLVPSASGHPCGLASQSPVGSNEDIHQSSRRRYESVNENCWDHQGHVSGPIPPVPSEVRPAKGSKDAIHSKEKTCTGCTPPLVIYLTSEPPKIRVPVVPRQKVYEELLEQSDSDRQTGQVTDSIAKAGAEPPTYLSWRKGGV